MSRPTIVFVNRVYPPVRGATGRLLRDLARSFAREGWNVSVITTGPKSEKKGRDGPIQVIRVKGPEKPASIFGYMWVWLKMFMALLRLPPQHLIVTMTDPPMLVVAGSAIARIKKSRHIHWCQDLYPDVLPALGRHVPRFLLAPFTWLGRFAMKRCDKSIVIGRCMAQRLSNDGLDPQKITVIPNWPDFELMRPVPNTLSLKPVPPEGAKPYESLLKNDSPKFRILYAGNIGHAHPLNTIIDAADLLHVSNPEIEFVFVGDGVRFDEVAHERSRRGLDNIRLLPYQPANKLKELMESGDVHLISMKNEALGCIVPSKLYAALAAQRPIILLGPREAETAKVIEDFHAGDVLPQGDAQALADTVLAYRYDSTKWFNAQQGAIEASKIFVPRESIEAWMERARGVVQPDFAGHTLKKRA